MLTVNWMVRNKFEEISTKVQNFSFKKMHFKLLFSKGWQFWSGLNELNEYVITRVIHIRTFKKNGVVIKLNGFRPGANSLWRQIWHPGSNYWDHYALYLWPVIEVMFQITRINSNLVCVHHVLYQTPYMVIMWQHKTQNSHLITGNSRYITNTSQIPQYT